MHPQPEQFFEEYSPRAAYTTDQWLRAKRDRLLALASLTLALLLPSTSASLRLL